MARRARRPLPESSPSSSSKVDVAKAREWGGSFHPESSETQTSLLSSHFNMASLRLRLSASALPLSDFCQRDASWRSKPPPACASSGPRSRRTFAVECRAAGAPAGCRPWLLY